VKTKLLYLLFLTPLLFTGCSSIVDGGRDNHVKIDSHPTGAKLSIYDKHGKAVATNSTPVDLVLKSGTKKGPDE